MSDWLERDLAHELAPVAAPGMLRVRLGLTPAKRWEFSPVALAVAAAVVMIIGGGYAASRTAALDIRELAAREVRCRDTAEFSEGGAPLVGARLVRCDGGAGLPLQVNAGK